MEDTEECAPVTVEGPWTPAQVKTLKNKLQLYFQSKKKSGGGECRVEAVDGAPRAEVFFSSAEVRERVLARQNHEIVLDNQTVKLHLSSGANPKNGCEAPEPLQSVSVVLDNIGDMSREILLMLLENISGLDDSHYSLEIIPESNRAVVTFSNPTDGERFLSVGQSSEKLQKHKLSARQLEAAKSVRVERLPPTVINDMLELYFDVKWTQPGNIVMIPDEEAAIVTFKDPKVVKSICIKEDYSIVSIPVKVYPYFESLSSALYGKGRPSWKMPKPFTEIVSHIIWKYLQENKLIKSINDHMRQYFCSINMDTPQTELTPLPNFLRQKGLTAQQVDAWESSARDAFRQHMSQYTVFECPANELAWKAAEAEVHSIIGGNVFLVFDGSRGVLTVAGGADDIKRIRASVESIVLKAISQIERQTNGVSDFVNLSPPMYFILQQVGLQKAAQDIFPQMTLAYDKNSQKLTITGLVVEVSKTKTWILEQHMAMSKKQLNVPPGILDFLRTVDPMDMSNRLFTSQGISTIFTIESKGVLLTGRSAMALADAEEKMKEILTVMDVDVEDQGVLNLQSWNDLKQQLLDKCNSKKMKTVSIQDHPGREDKITVAGFWNPVNKVHHYLTDFIWKYSRTQESIRVKSVVLQFIEKKKSLEWSSIAKDNGVKVNLDPLKQRIFIEGVRLHIQKAKSCFKDLTSSLFCDYLSVNKRGAKKFFQSQEFWFQTVLMSDFGCVVTLRPENQEEEEGENLKENNGVSYCKVRTAAGVHVSVSKADICHFGMDGKSLKLSGGYRQGRGRGGERQSPWNHVVTSFFLPGGQRRSPANLVLEAGEFEPTVFELCADNERAVTLAKKKIEELILKEPAKKMIKDQYISQLSQGDMDELKDLQRNLTVSITLDRGQQGQEPTICLEGLTRDVLTAEVSIRAIFQKVERQVNLRSMLMSTVVQWQFQHHDGMMVPFDPLTNLKLEEAFKNQQIVQIQINNEPYNTDPWLKKAVSLRGHKMVLLLRKDLRKDNSSPLPQHWDDMKGDLLKLIPLNPGDKEYSDVQILLTETGLTPTIIKIERVQNPTLWQSYQLKKQQLEKKNKHKNERRLFHGTKANSIDLINQHGFNRSYSGKHVAMYGNGSYFAVDPCYSARGYATPDRSGYKRMYLARVLVGDFTRGAQGMITPPAKNFWNVSDLYDSVTDNTANPSMFIVFNDMQAYPEYLITFI